MLSSSLLAVVAMLVSTGSAAALEPTGTDATSSSAPTPVVEPPVYLWEDFDQDNLRDVFVHVSGGESRLLRNRGAGLYEDVTSMAGLSGLVRVRATSWVDFDVDGLVDLYVVTAAGKSLLLHNSGASFTDVTESSGIAESAAIVISEWIAADRDELPDLHVVTTISDRIWRNAGSGRFEASGILPSGVDSATVGLTGSGPTATPGRSNEAGLGCLPSITDQADLNTCLQASSVPTLGMLYPLSDKLFVSAGGNVGVNTINPTERLDVRGKIRTRVSASCSLTGRCRRPLRSPALSVLKARPARRDQRAQQARQVLKVRLVTRVQRARLDHRVRQVTQVRQVQPARWVRPALKATRVRRGQLVRKVRPETQVRLVHKARRVRLAHKVTQARRVRLARLDHRVRQATPVRRVRPAHKATRVRRVRPAHKATRVRRVRPAHKATRVRLAQPVRKV